MGQLVIVRMKLNFCLLALAGLAAAADTASDDKTAVTVKADPAATGTGGGDGGATDNAKADDGASAADVDPAGTGATDDAGDGTDDATDDGTDDATDDATDEAKKDDSPVDGHNDKGHTDKEKTTPKPEPENGAAVASMSLGTLLAVYFAL